LPYNGAPTDPDQGKNRLNIDFPSVEPH